MNSLHAFQNRFEEPDLDSREVADFAIESLYGDISEDWTLVEEAITEDVYSSADSEKLAKAFVEFSKSPCDIDAIRALADAADDVICRAIRRKAEGDYDRAVDLRGEPL